MTHFLVLKIQQGFWWESNLWPVQIFPSVTMSNRGGKWHTFQFSPQPLARSEKWHTFHNTLCYLAHPTKVKTFFQPSWKPFCRSSVRFIPLRRDHVVYLSNKVTLSKNVPNIKEDKRPRSLIISNKNQLSIHHLLIMMDMFSGNMRHGRKEFNMLYCVFKTYLEDGETIFHRHHILFR